MLCPGYGRITKSRQLNEGQVKAKSFFPEFIGKLTESEEGFCNSVTVAKHNCLNSDNYELGIKW